jgi:hypothetical protein
MALGILVRVIAEVGEEVFLVEAASRPEEWGLGGETEVGEDLPYDRRIAEEGHDHHGDRTANAGEHVEVEHSFE